MKRLPIGDIHRPLAPASVVVLGAAGRRARKTGPSDPDLCQACAGSLPFAGSCPCGALFGPF